MSARTWQQSVLKWLDAQASQNAQKVTIYYNKTVIQSIELRGSQAERDAVVEALEDVGSLAGGARTYVLVSYGDSQELGRLDVKVDAKAIALARDSDRELSTREASATAQVIAATDHRTVQATIKSVAEQNSESHNALVAMTKVFGEAAGAVLKGNAEIVKTLDARAERDAKEIDRLAEENAKLRTQNQALDELAKEAMAQAEKFKSESQDLVLLCRASFGEQFRDVLQKFLATRNGVASDGAALFAQVLNAEKGNPS